MQEKRNFAQNKTLDQPEGAQFVDAITALRVYLLITHTKKM